jgi:predicted site-specific integrase-resolvase
MAKDKERKLAYDMYVNECLTGKEIAKRLHVQEKTVSDWVKVGKWKEVRLSKQTTSDTLIGKYNELLASLLDRRLLFEKKSSKSDEEKDEHRNIIDEMSKIAAMIDRVQKDGRVSMRTHIHCIEKFMAYVNTNKPEAFSTLIDLLREYLMLLTEELK